MGRVITLASGKGGTGKTTITANLGIALAMRKQKVLLIDADVAMSNLSLILGMQSSPITLHEVLLGEAGIEDAIYEGPKGIELIPSGLSLESYRKVDSERLKSVVDQVKDDYDFVLLDAPAGIGKDTLSSISAADQVLLIVDPSSPAIADALKTKIIAQKIGSKPFGIIINFMRKEKGEVKKEQIMKLMELPAYGIIPFDTEVRKTFMLEQVEPIIIRKPDSPASKAIHKTAAKLTGLEVEFEEEKKSVIQSFLDKLFKRK